MGLLQPEEGSRSTNRCPHGRLSGAGRCLVWRWGRDPRAQLQLRATALPPGCTGRTRQVGDLQSQVFKGAERAEATADAMGRGRRGRCWATRKQPSPESQTAARVPSVSGATSPSHVVVVYRSRSLAHSSTCFPHWLDFPDGDGDAQAQACCAPGARGIAQVLREERLPSAPTRRSGPRSVLLPGVTLPMANETRAVGKGFPTFLALVRLLSGVRLLMF